MKFIEKVFIVFGLIGILSKTVSAPFSTLMLLIALGGLSLLYVSFSFLLYNDIELKGIFKKDSYMHTSARDIAIAVGCGLANTAMLAGMLLKLQNWPVAPIIFVGGLIVNAILILILFAIERSFTGTLIRNCGARAFGLLITWVQLSMV